MDIEASAVKAEPNETIYNSWLEDNENERNEEAANPNAEILGTIGANPGKEVAGSLRKKKGGKGRKKLKKNSKMEEMVEEDQTGVTVLGAQINPNSKEKQQGKEEERERDEKPGSWERETMATDSPNNQDVSIVGSTSRFNMSSSSASSRQAMAIESLGALVKVQVKEVNPKEIDFKEKKEEGAYTRQELQRALKIIEAMIEKRDDNEREMLRGHRNSKRTRYMKNDLPFFVSHGHKELSRQKMRDIPEHCWNNLCKYRAIVFYYAGLSILRISEMVNINHGTVHRWITKFEETGDIVKLRPRSGRRTKLTPEVESLLKYHLKDDPYSSCRKLANIIKSELGIEIARHSVSCYMKKFGKYRTPQQIMVISPDNKQKRIDYAQLHADDDFGNVIFTDETMFQLGYNSKKVFVLNGEQCPQVPMVYPVSTVMVWGAISKKGKIAMTFVKDTLTKEKYLSILENSLLPNAKIAYGEEKWRFQQDNNPCHTAYSVKEWIRENIPEDVGHPPQSPDLNPIEFIWGMMKINIGSKNVRNKEELCDAIQQAWDNVTNETCFNVIEHMVKKVLPRVVEEGGDFIR